MARFVASHSPAPRSHRTVQPFQLHSTENRHVKHQHVPGVRVAEAAVELGAACRSRRVGAAAGAFAQCLAAPSLAGYVKYAQQHRAIIERFGRFPHRNTVLGRPSSTEETAFLQLPGSRF
ncbi:DUF924 family protein [Piscinibacter sp.]|uniref:DUF924 family protein n=1 Tax=Piscinibacter sp. TaxID=1903157 RepID=UPI003559AA56